MASRRELRVLCAMLLIATFVSLIGVAGAGDSKLPEGVWRTKERQGEAYGFIEFRKDMIIIDGFDEIPVTYVDENGKLTLQSEEFPGVLPTINVIDADTIELTLPGSGELVPLVRSSKEELETTLRPSPERIFGAWIEERRDGEDGLRSTLVIAKDGLTFNGRFVPGTVSGTSGGYDTELGRIILQDNGKLKGLFFSELLETYSRSTEEEIHSTLETRGKFLEKFYGVWKKAGTDGEADAFLDISREQISHGGETFGYYAVFKAEDRIVVFPAVEGLAVFSAWLRDNGNLSVGDQFGDREREFVRASPADIEGKNTGK